MTIFYVATLARYVLVEAEDVALARQSGGRALHDLYVDVRQRLGREVPIDIRTVREATPDEVELGTWHQDNARKGGKIMRAILRPGQRIRLLAMRDDPDPIQAGQMGTVVSATRHGGGKDAWHQIDVAWDNGRTLMLVSPPDEIEIITDPRHTSS